MDIAAACRSEQRTLVTLDTEEHILGVLSRLVPQLATSDFAGKLWIVEETRIRERT